MQPTATGSSTFYPSAGGSTGFSDDGGGAEKSKVHLIATGL